jgi:hypothetical protein
VQNYPGLGGQSTYKAATNSPEGRPFDLYLRATHDLFRNELGHPATSKVISLASNVQLGFLLLLGLILGWYQVMGYHSGGLLWTLAANLVAAYGTMSVGLPDHSGLQRLAREISK